MRLIDADAFERAVMFSDDEDIQDVIYRLRDFPSAQLEIIRCKDCQHAQEDILANEWFCNGARVRPDHYCGYAEREQDG